MDLKLLLDAAEVEQLITGAFSASGAWFHIEDLNPGFVRVRMPHKKWMARPGDVTSGPALFNVADLAMYALVLSHVGPEMMAVTCNMNLNFLNKGVLGDLHGEGRLLKLGRKLAVMEVKVYCGDDPALVAIASGSYAIPSAKTA